MHSSLSSSRFLGLFVPVKIPSWGLRSARSIRHLHGLRSLGVPAGRGNCIARAWKRAITDIQLDSMASRKIEDVASEDQAGAGQNETLVDPFRILAPTGTDVQRLRERYELITSNVVLPNFQLFAVEQWSVHPVHYNSNIQLVQSDGNARSPGSTGSSIARGSSQRLSLTRGTRRTRY